MKQIKIYLLLSLLWMSACQMEKYEFLNNTYTGIHPALDTPDSESSAPMQASYEMKIRIDAGKIYIGEENPEYTIEEENEEFLILSAVFQNEDFTNPVRFKYNKQNKELLMMNENPARNIVFMTKESMLEKKLNSFVSVPLSTDISHLSANQKEMVKLLFRVADIMDEIYWTEAYGDKSSLMETADSETLRKLYQINYGPWERLNDQKPFLSRFDQKPAGANFYPADMTKEEFAGFQDDNKDNLYTIIRRNESGSLNAIWYHEFFQSKIHEASELLLKASELADDPGFAKYLELRSKALLNDDYYESDIAWMEMKNNLIDFVVGPIENYEDGLFAYKAAHESFLLIRDMEWSEKLTHLVALLPMLQENLPVEEKFKKEVPGTRSDLNVYDAVYYAGDCNAGSKTIAINLPNDPRVRADYGSRKLQLKNSIRYKFEKILIPISNVLIAEDQRQYIDFNAFFENTMFHEVAHGLGLDYTIDEKSSVREALKECYSPIEEGKADILGLFIVTKLAELGELGEKDLMTNYVTFMASIFRSVRFGAASAHGKANMIRFYYFQEKGAFTRDKESETYRINFEKMKEAMNSLSNEIISIQGLGNYRKAAEIIAEKAYIREELQADLNRLNELSIPVDLVFEQGPELLGL